MGLRQSKRTFSDQMRIKKSEKDSMMYGHFADATFGQMEIDICKTKHQIIEIKWFKYELVYNPVNVIYYVCDECCLPSNPVKYNIKGNTKTLVDCADKCTEEYEYFMIQQGWHRIIYKKIFLYFTYEVYLPAEETQSNDLKIAEYFQKQTNLPATYVQRRRSYISYSTEYSVPFDINGMTFVIRPCIEMLKHSDKYDISYNVTKMVQKYVC